MKKILTILCLAFASVIFAQTEGINYQAVILNNADVEIPGQDMSNTIYPNKPVKLRFTIINENGQNEYQEVQNLMTNEFGMVNTIIGGGSPTINSFDEILWNGNQKNLLVEIDFSTTNGFVELSNQKLTYLPYSKYRDLSASGNLTVEGVSNLNDLSVSGTTTLDNLEVINYTDLNTLAVSGDANLQTLDVEGLSNIVELNVSGNSLLDNLEVTNATTLNDLTVDGSTTLEDVTINDELTVSSQTNLSSLVVSTDQAVDDGDSNQEHIALFQNTGGGNGDGIAIRIDRPTLSSQNHFITFYGQGDYMAGRIESYDLYGGDLWETFPIPDFTSLFNLDFSGLVTGGELPSLSFSGGSLPSASFNQGSLPSASLSTSGLSFSAGSLPSLSFNPGSLPTANLDVGEFPTINWDNLFDISAAMGSNAQSEITPMVAWGLRNGYPGFIPSTKLQIIVTPLILAANQVARNQGVVYGSKGADYAEWLEKENPEEKFVFGEVVGVKGGKISKNTTNADNVMTISLNPIVLGNLPDENKKDSYEKVGFMGQVPVLVTGKVNVGDILVASGFNDGYAKAIHPDDIKIKDLKTVIGRAWSSSSGGINMVNASVGLKTNEWISILENQNDKLEELSKKVEDIQKKIETLGL